MGKILAIRRAASCPEYTSKAIYADENEMRDKIKNDFFEYSLEPVEIYELKGQVQLGHQPEDFNTDPWTPIK